MKGFLSFLLVLFAIAALFRVDFFFAILYFLLAVYLLSRLWSRRMMDPLQAGRQFGRRAFHGEEIPVELQVRNAGRLPVPWLELTESLPVQLTAPPIFRQVVTLGPRERRSFGYTLIGRRRGYYPIGPLRMTGGGLLGLHPPRTAQLPADYLIVYPQVLPLPRLGLPTHSPLVALPARSPLFEDPSCVTGVRDYQRGDSPRRIHWTATASTGRLLVKQYRPSIARETLICLDLSRQGYDPDYRFTAPELAIVTAASIANHIIVRDGLPAGLSTEAVDPLIGEMARFFLPPRPGRGQLTSLLEVLARAELAPAAPLAERLRRESVRLPWGATVVAITGRETGALHDTLVFLRRANFAVVLILVQQAKVSAALRQRAELVHIPVHRVWRERDLQGGFGDER